MLQNYNTYRIVSLFFDSPTKHFQLREISRMIRIGLPSVKAHVEKLETAGLIRKTKGNIYDSFVATRNDRFKLYKRNDVMIRIHESGLLEYLVDELSPDVIVLFGSASKGDDIEHSDVDIFVLAEDKKLKLDKFEKILKRKINILFENKIKNIPKELMSNIINGVVLYGYLEVF
ncbi:MAG: nucleotidyltransferase domain-containing protein [Candidatus Aenigmarchaeota archaeon]|nr:nucleotidyltransferase domain-containing protein [Candidatus Aenigmarchaeota archaeon]